VSDTRKVIFLDRVQVNKFAISIKAYSRERRRDEREVRTKENPYPPAVFTVVGTKMLNEGYTDYDSEEGYRFVTAGRCKVYIVADGLTNHKYVLPEDIVLFRENQPTCPPPTT
jgi:hypothetical protein